MKSKGHISLENSPGCPQLISKYSLGTFVQPVLSHPNYTDFFFQSTNMLCSNVLNVLIKLRAVPPNYLVNHSIKHKGNPKKIRERKKGNEVDKGQRRKVGREGEIRVIWSESLLI